MNKPTKPNITIPKSFAANGEKNDFNDDMLLNGFDRIKQEVVPGDALNKFIDDSYQGLNYSMDGVDDLYKGIVLYSATETYNTTSLVFNISEAGIKLYHSLVNNNKGNSLTDATKWEEVSLGGGLPVGTILTVTASANYVPENLLYCDGTELSGAEGQTFRNLWTDYILTGKLDTCTYSEYETELTMTGSCWKWAVDTANEKFRIPFIPDKLSERFLVEKKEPTETDPMWYNLYSDGWCEQGGRSNTSIEGWVTVTLMKEYKNKAYTILTSRAKDYTSSTTSSHAYTSDNAAIINDMTVTTSSFQFYQQGNSDGSKFTDWETSGYIDFKVEKTIRHYVVVATGSINQSEADWSEFASSLADKANVRLDNVIPSASFRRDSVRWGIPDYEQMVEIDVVSGGTTTYAAAYDGIFWGKQISSTTAKTVKINGHEVFSHFTNSGTISNGFFFPVYQGDIVMVENTTTNNNQYLYFAPYRE